MLICEQEFGNLHNPYAVSVRDQSLLGSASLQGQLGSSSSQGQAEEEEADEDVVDLLDDVESLEVVQQPSSTIWLMTACGRLTR